jgi:hypothetical protein
MLFILIKILSIFTNYMEDILLEKLIVAQLVNKFLVFYGTRRFITVII